MIELQAHYLLLLRIRVLNVEYVFRRIGSLRFWPLKQPKKVSSNIVTIILIFLLDNKHFLLEYMLYFEYKGISEIKFASIQLFRLIFK